MNLTLIIIGFILIIIGIVIFFAYSSASNYVNQTTAPSQFTNILGSIYNNTANEATIIFVLAGFIFIAIGIVSG